MHSLALVLALPHSQLGSYTILGSSQTQNKKLLTPTNTSLLVSSLFA